MPDEFNMLVHRMSDQEKAFLVMVAKGLVDLGLVHGKPNGEVCFKAILSDGGIRKRYMESSLVK